MTAGAAAVGHAQDRQPIFRIKVDMVVLSFQVTDSKNRYINGLKPTDFRIYEDGILQKIAVEAGQPCETAHLLRSIRQRR